MNDAELAPNHHAHHAPFTGIVGITAALTMITGRDAEARLAVELSSLVAGETVIDIGCGPGAAVRKAARLGAIAVGIDPAPIMLRTARLLTRGHVSYRRGSAEQLPARDGEASVVWSIATVHHWHDLNAALDEVRRVLAPKGRFVAIEHRSHAGAHGLATHGWTREQADKFANLCEAHGFVDGRVDEHTHKDGASMSVVASVP